MKAARRAISPGFPDFFRQGGNHFEETADNAVTGHFEDSGVRLLLMAMIVSVPVPTICRATPETPTPRYMLGS